MTVRLHPHEQERLGERGATIEEVVSTVRHGERFPAKYGRVGFRRNFSYGEQWKGRHYSTKQVEAYAVQENSDWIVITVLTRFF